MVICDFILTIFGGLCASILAIIIWECYKKPKISIDIKKSQADDQEPAISGEGLALPCEGTEKPQPVTKKLAFYHLDVQNNGRSVASDCQAELIFHNATKTELFKIDHAKWDSKPEPVVVVMINHTPVRVFEPNLIHASEFVNINPASHQSFALLLKYDDEEQCYPFNAWNYRCSDLRSKNRLDNGIYYVTVNLTFVGGKSKTVNFKIKNQGEKADSIKIERNLEE